MKLSILMLFTFFLSGCTSTYPGEVKIERSPVCQGFGCKKGPGTFPNNAATHKPTKDEKIRVRQGLPPNFGSEEITISAPVYF